MSDLGKVKIRFLYYKCLHTDMERPYNALSVLDRILDLDMQSRIKDFRGVKGRLESCEFGGNKEISLYRFMRLDDESKAYKVREMEEAEHIDLANDEYLGTSTLALYDARNMFWMIQSDRMGFGATMIQNYISSFMEGGCILKTVIDSHDAESLLRGKQVRGIEIGLYDVSGFEAKKSRFLENCIKCFRNTGCVTAKLKIGVGRNRKLALNPSEIEDVIADVTDNFGALSSAKLAVKEDGVGSKVESIDLLLPVLRSEFHTQLTDGKEIDFGSVYAQMESTYLQKRNEILLSL